MNDLDKQLKDRNFQGAKIGFTHSWILKTQIKSKISVKGLIMQCPVNIDRKREYASSFSLSSSSYLRSLLWCQCKALGVSRIISEIIIPFCLFLTLSWLLTVGCLICFKDILTLFSLFFFLLKISAFVKLDLTTFHM